MSPSNKRTTLVMALTTLPASGVGDDALNVHPDYYRGFAQGAYYGLMLEGGSYDEAWCLKYELEAQGEDMGTSGEFQAKLDGLLTTCRARVAEQAGPGPGYASFARTTLLARLSDLGPSVTFWRDVMGFEYGGNPEPRTGSASKYLGWSAEATTYFTAFKSKEGSTVALLLVEDEPNFPELELPGSGVAYGGMVLVHTAKNIRDIYERALEHGTEIIKPYGPSRTGRSIQMMFRAPTGQIVEVYELIEAPQSE